jgi:Transposase
MGDWLRSCGLTQVAMESTGVYGKPVWNLLEGQFEVLLVNAQHSKAVPGRKRDQKDSEWIADLLQHGLLRPSFVPPTPLGPDYFDRLNPDGLRRLTKRLEGLGFKVTLEPLAQVP